MSEFYRELDRLARNREEARLREHLESRPGGWPAPAPDRQASSDADSARECRIPPAGWYCTRGAGHEGPCAAWPEVWTECAHLFHCARCSYLAKALAHKYANDTEARAERLEAALRAMPCVGGCADPQVCDPDPCPRCEALSTSADAPAALRGLLVEAVEWVANFSVYLKAGSERRQKAEDLVRRILAALDDGIHVQNGVISGQNGANSGQE